MQNKKHLFFFGFCLAGTLYHRFEEAQSKSDQQALKYTAGTHFYPAGSFEEDFFYTDEHTCVTYSAPREMRNTRTLIKGMPQQSEIHAISPRKALPVLCKGDAIYIYASPIFEYRKIRMAFTELANDDRFISYHEMECIVQSEFARIFQFLVELKKKKLNVVVVEGTRNFPFKVNPVRYNAIVNLYRSVMKNEIKKIGLPLIEIPDYMHDEFGFTQEKYRNRSDDEVHVNREYSKILLDIILNILESENFFDNYCDKANTLPVGDDIKWTPHATVAELIHNHEKSGLLNLLATRDTTYNALEEAHRNLQTRYKSVRRRLIKAEEGLRAEKLNHFEQKETQQEDWREVASFNELFMLCVSRLICRAKKMLYKGDIAK